MTAALVRMIVDQEKPGEPSFVMRVVAPELNAGTNANMLSAQVILQTRRALVESVAARLFK